jgi:hypothetical protein
MDCKTHCVTSFEDEAADSKQSSSAPADINCPIPPFRGHCRDKEVVEGHAEVEL